MSTVQSVAHASRRPEITLDSRLVFARVGAVPRIYTLSVDQSRRLPVVHVQPSLGWWNARQSVKREASEGDVRRHGARPLSEPPGAGLSKRHNCKERGRNVASLRYREGGSLVQIEGVRKPPSDKKPKGKRGRVIEWSGKSRLRLKYDLGRLSRCELAKAHFLTLTYPACFPEITDHATYKGHLHHFTTRLYQLYPGACGVWKLEFQQRGAAHYHLLVFGLPASDVAGLRSVIARLWFDVVGSGDDKHLRAGTGVDQARSVGGSMSYMAKYISKDDQTRPGNFTGRYWGKFNAKCLPYAPEKTLELVGSSRVAVVRRWMRRLVEKRVSDARWKVAESKLVGHFSSRLQWEWCKSKARNKRKMHFLLYPDVVCWMSSRCVHFDLPGTDRKFRPPARYSVRNNSAVNLLCNVSSFIDAVGRAIDLGLLPEEKRPF